MLQKHLHILRQQPQNGRFSMAAIDETLKQMRGNRRRMKQVAIKMEDETQTVRKLMVKENAANTDHS